MIVKVKDVAKLQGGYAFKSADFVRGGIPIVRIGNIVENKIFVDDKITINDYEFKKVHPEFVINKGDILVAMSGATVGKIGVYELEEESLLNQRVGKFVTTDKVNGKYLYYILRSKLFNKYILENAFGCAQPNISGKQIEEFEFKLYEKEQQKQIIEILDRVQESIDIRKKQIESLDSLIKARFVELFGDTILNPFGWEKDSLGTVCDVRDGTHDSPKYHETGYPLVTSKNVTGGKIDLTDCSLICEEDFNKINERSKVDIGDIIMPMIGTVGKPVIVDIEPNFAIKNVALIKFEADSRVLNVYVRALLQSDYFDDAVLSKVRGGTQKFISLGDIRKLGVLVPPMELQKQFAAFIEQTDKSKVELQKSLEEMQNLFDSLMAEYFG